MYLCMLLGSSAVVHPLTTSTIRSSGVKTTTMSVSPLKQQPPIFAPTNIVSTRRLWNGFYAPDKQQFTVDNNVVLIRFCPTMLSKIKQLHSTYFLSSIHVMMSGICIVLSGIGMTDIIGPSWRYLCYSST
jgi:hypothetical protein